MICILVFCIAFPFSEGKPIEMIDKSVTPAKGEIHVA
jgi:hypothetical protein